MSLRLYNTLTRQKEDFVPIDASNVRLYVCGPTVYDFAHIGNARPVIVFDVLFRLLKHLAAKGEWDNGKGLTKVTYVRNITDVDDKINARALRDFPELPLNDAIAKVTEKTANQFFADAKALGCLEPTVQPRATQHISGMVEMINKLLASENAYIATGSEGREVLFEVSKMSDYGILSGRILEDQQAGARVAVEAHKKNPADFVLWKESGVSQPGWMHDFTPMSAHGYEGEFTITEGQRRASGLNSNRVTIHGRPGWHIECSAMSMNTLLSPYGGGYDVADKTKNTFDIHGGGLDLIFPHHENEIAQSCCALGVKRMANVWMHNGFLQVEGQKMSKSLGNFRTIAEELKKKKGEVLRLAMLMTHYRQPIDWTNDRLAEANSKLGSLISSVRFAIPENGKILPSVLEALKDDLNIHEAIRKLETSYSAEKNDLAYTLVFLGLMESDDINFKLGRERHSGNLESVRGAMETVEKREFLISISKDESWVDNQIIARNVARAAKDWKKSDDIRIELDKMGIAIKDNKDGKTTWEVKR